MIVTRGEGDARVELGLRVINDPVTDEGAADTFARAMLEDGQPEEAQLGRLRLRIARETRRSSRARSAAATRPRPAGDLAR